MRQAAGSVGGSIRRLAVSFARRSLLLQLLRPVERAGYHQCWSRIAFLQVRGEDVGARGSSVLADSSAPFIRNLNSSIKTLEPVISHYRCASMPQRVEFVTTAGDHPSVRQRASYTGGWASSTSAATLACQPIRHLSARSPPPLCPRTGGNVCSRHSRAGHGFSCWR